MKKLVLASFLMAGSLTMFAQNRNDHGNDRNKMPQTIQKDFERNNPGANANWERDKNNQWHGTYMDKNNKQVEIYYDHNGRRLSQHRAWNRNDIPKTLDTRFYNKYHTRDYQAYRIERPNAQPLFQLKFTFGGKDKIVYMDQQGREQKYSHPY